MNILIIGAGGREHALAWKLQQSEQIKDLYIAPGNAGTQYIGKNINIIPSDFKSMGDFILERKISMVIVGPEAPLVDGIYDYFSNHQELEHILLIGPSKKGAMLEGSKEFAKNFMSRHNIPTAKYKSFGKENKIEAKKFLETLDAPFVIKADGLAAGKGVIILDSISDAKQELDDIFNGKFGKAGDKVVIEEFMNGIEFSVFIVTDGKSYKILPNAKDYKKAGEGDTGLNTGGMGAVSPVPFVHNNLMKKVEEKIIKPTINGLATESIYYKGFLYFGLMKIDNEPYVIEYNVRLGDPEAEVVLPRIKSDLLEIFSLINKQQLHEAELEIDGRTVATVVLASGGYPGSYENGKDITGLEEIKESLIFHAGTKISGGKVVTNGGRVLAVTAYGKDMQEALDNCYQNTNNINFEGKYYRKDIGFDL
jgi:phosphoribosylamine--glycine ligase